MRTINVIVTTISGSIKDWGKVGSIESEFKKHYSGKVNVCITNGHKEAYTKTAELINLGETIFVSAGGAGTFNSVLEGSRRKNGFQKEYRLAFLRKGSADLIGKALHIPDDLPSAVRIISESIKQDKTIESDVIEMEINGTKRHFIGFGGIGIMGIVPFFTENRFIKHYKGFLGYFFGDRGPFFVGVNLALLKYYKDTIIRKRIFSVTINSKVKIKSLFSSIIILNGDLGKDMPLAKGMKFDSGSFKVILVKDLGIFNAYRQLFHAWTGNFEEHKEKYGIKTFFAKGLEISPIELHKYMVNIDSLSETTNTAISFKISERIKLITG